ncbi:MAG: hypothetical protein ACK40G_05440 [Cytophagaceae bacterium]
MNKFAKNIKSLFRDMVNFFKPWKKDSHILKPGDNVEMTGNESRSEGLMNRGPSSKFMVTRTGQVLRRPKRLHGKLSLRTRRKTF